MSIFDFLVEAKMKAWNKEVQQPDYVAPPPVEKTAPGKSFEGHLLDDIKQLINQAAQQAESSRCNDLLSKAKDLEIQLISSLEGQGLFLMAQTMQTTIYQHKCRALSNP